MSGKRKPAVVFKANTLPQQKINEFVTAAGKGRLKEVEDCVQHKNIDINGLQEKTGETALHAACRNDRNDIVTYLIESGADVNVQDQRNRHGPLHTCAMFGNVDALSALVCSDGINVNLLDKEGQTALHIAAREGKSECVRALAALVRCEVDRKNKNGQTPLHLAARANSVKCLKLLHATARCDLLAVDSLEQNILHIAGWYGSLDAIKWMREPGVLVNPTIPAKASQSTEASGKQDPVYAHDFARENGHPNAEDLLLAYFKDYQRWEEQLGKAECKPKTVKLFFCGSAEVGKTMLLESMQRSYLTLKKGKGDPVTEFNRTKGINIELIFDGSFSAWDFAGQMEDYVTHEFFLTTSNTIFLVLVRLDNDPSTQKKQLSRWLRFIKTCNQGNQGLQAERRSTRNAAEVATRQGLTLLHAPVVVVCSHADEFKGPESEHRRKKVLEHASELRGVFKDYLDISEKVFFLDCTNLDANMRELRTFLLERREQLLEEQAKIPVLCQVIAEKLQEKNWHSSGADSLVPFEAYQDWVHRNVNPLVDETKLRGVTKCLMSSASVVYFDMSKLRRWLVLDPVWLCSGVLGKILMPQTYKTKAIDGKHNGVIERAVFRELFPISNHEALLELITHFELCFPLDKDYIQLPSTVMEVRPPATVWPASSPSPTGHELITVGRRMTCTDNTDLFSPGFFPRLQVGIRRFFRPADDKLTLWRGGLYMKHNHGGERETETLLEMNQERHLDVCCRGRKDWARGLWDHLDTVLQCCKKTLEQACPRLRLCTEALSVASMSKAGAGGRDRLSYAMETLCLEERLGEEVIIHPSAYQISERIVDLLYCGLASKSLREQGIRSHIMHLDETVLKKLNDMLSPLDPNHRDWRLLAQHLALGDQMELFNIRPDFAARRVLDKFSESPKASIKSLIDLLRNKVGRIDVATMLETEVQEMLRDLRNPEKAK